MANGLVSQATTEASEMFFTRIHDNRAEIKKQRCKPWTGMSYLNGKRKIGKETKNKKTEKRPMINEDHQPFCREAKCSESTL